MSEPTRAARDWRVAIALAAVFAFTGLANHALRVPDEPRVAGIAWEMQHTGDWIPHLSGVPFLEHPPLFYAVLGAFIRAFGASDGVARLPSAIASFFTALLVFSLARRFADRSAGIPALFALVGIAGFARYSHRAMVDPLLALFAMCGYYAYARAVFRPAPPASPGEDRLSAGWLVAVYAAAALGFWVKGPVGVVAIAGPIPLHASFTRRWSALWTPVHLVALPLLIAVCAAWPIALYRAGGAEMAGAFALNNVWYRIIPAAGAGHYAGGHENPVWYYLLRMFGQLGWITAFVPLVAAWLWRGGGPPGWNLAALRFLACAFPIGVLLLSIPGTKRAVYLLPFEPPLAVAIGAWIAAARRADCFAPGRVAMLLFAAAIAWNAIGLRFVDRDRELAPMVRAVGARVGPQTLFVLSPSEDLLGALPFYTGRIPQYSREVAQLPQQLAESGVRFLLAPALRREQILAELGANAVLVQTWTAARDDYVLFAVSPAVATSPEPTSHLMSN